MYIHTTIICVTSLQNGPLVGRIESGMIPDWSKNIFLNFNLSLFYLLIRMLMNIVFYVSTVGNM